MSDEINPTNEAPDGAPATGAAGDMVARSELTAAVDRADRMTAQRRDLGAKYDAALARIGELEATPAAEPEKAAPSSDGGEPAWAQALSAKVDALAVEFTGDKSTRAREGALDKILERIPDGNRQTAKLVLRGSDIDFTDPGAVDSALAILQQTNVMHDPTRRSPHRAPQTSPDQAPNFDKCESWDDIPHTLRGAVPDDVAARLSGRGSVGQRNDGHLI